HYETAFHILDNDLIPNINEEQSELIPLEHVVLLSDGISYLMDYFDKNPEATFTLYIVKDYTSYYEVEL
ncbi:hypothetical protein I6F02_06450, partial [Staphylococcus aureus]|nr:hypothetical protein [Staphylococcus aureus]